MTHAAEARPAIVIERLDEFHGTDLDDLCDAAETAILDGGGFGWLKPPPRNLMERFWKGVLLVPERELWVGRLDGRIAGAAQLVSPPRNNEVQGRIATITMNFVAPWARRRGIGREMVQAAEKSAYRRGFWFINLDVRESQTAAIALCESLGYVHWGTNPNYAVVEGRVIPGRYYTKQLRAPRGPRARQEREPA
jgi:ribosomal protein S18 acetylase RimI-like enzyme